MNKLDFSNLADESTGSKSLPVNEQVPEVEVQGCKWVDSDSNSPSNWSAIECTYSKGGGTLTDRMFIPSKQMTQPRPYVENDTVEAALAYKEGVFNRQLLYIAKALDCENEFLGCTTYEQACDVINNNCSNSKVYLKTTKNNQGYVECCRGNSTVNFIESMNVDECTLKYTNNQQEKLNNITVSYTHLTLPTIYSV